MNFKNTVFYFTLLLRENQVTRWDGVKNILQISQKELDDFFLLPTLLQTVTANNRQKLSLSHRGTHACMCTYTQVIEVTTSVDRCSQDSNVHTQSSVVVLSWCYSKYATAEDVKAELKNLW